MKKQIIITIALMFIVMVSKAQKNVYFTITHKLSTSDFAFNQTAQNDLMQDFKITRVDYYISSIKIIHDGGMEMVCALGFCHGEWCCMPSKLFEI
jgi:hypothetical protein